MNTIIIFLKFLIKNNFNNRINENEFENENKNRKKFIIILIFKNNDNN